MFAGADLAAVRRQAWRVLAQSAAATVALTALAAAVGAMLRH